jgi:DNA mismatch repair protein MutS
MTTTLIDPTTPGLTPLMKQFWEIKAQHTDKILLFRMGDFYEMFYSDAVTAAPILNIALTARNKKTATSPEEEQPMCGVPHHSIALPISKLLRAGLKVAICDQLEDPETAKGIVKRGVTRVLSPGMVYDPETLNELSANYIASYDEASVSFLDSSTGEAFFYRTQFETERDHLLTLLKPVELVLTQKQKIELFKAKARASVDSSTPLFIAGLAVHLTVFDEEVSSSSERLLKYSRAMQGENSLTIAPIFAERLLTEKMSLPATVIRHLEIFETYSGDVKGSLFNAINRTKTSAGARLLKSWLQFPLVKLELIERRLDEVATWLKKPTDLKVLRQALGSMGDIERRLSKISYSNCNVHDLVALEQSLSTGLSMAVFCPQLSKETLAAVQAVVAAVQKTLADDPPVQTKNGGFVRRGYLAELDELITLSDDSQKLLLELEAREKEQTQISSLKVRFNNVFGYYIEITNTHKDRVPDHYKRKQTLANAERYVTQELHELETKILSSRTKRVELEEKIFEDLRRKILNVATQLRTAALAWSELDVYSSLAYLSLEQKYVRPEFSKARDLNLEESRHPVVEQEVRQTFVPNNIVLKNGETLLLTGPNMAGKSTLMRQVAVTSVLAQIGSFVPAKHAELPLFDRIFTRIGASDFLSEGLSTFMVEMKETAQMLEQANANSLVVLDEVGRGTSTYDGMSLAQSILEFLVARKKPLVFFATHYHELTQLQRVHPQIKNGHMAIEEGGGEVKRAGSKEIKFLYVLKAGPANKSYGIHVARLAGLPKEVTARAEKLLAQHESALSAGGDTSGQMSLGFYNDDSVATESVNEPALTPKEALVLEQLRAMNAQSMTPIEALVKISEWQKNI